MMGYPERPQLTERVFLLGQPGGRHVVDNNVEVEFWSLAGLLRKAIDSAQVAKSP